MKTDLATELEFFVLVAKLGTLSGAARELDLTPPAATKRLAQMESRLGVRLVNRTTRSISLTTEGETYLSYATRILADLQEMENVVSSSGSEPRGLLRVNATLGFGRTTIAPLVSEFAKRYTHVEVQLEVTDRPVDLVDSGSTWQSGSAPFPTAGSLHAASCRTGGLSVHRRDTSSGSAPPRPSPI